MFGSEFMLDGGKGGLSLSSSSRTGDSRSGGEWSGNVNYADKTSKVSNTIIVFGAMALVGVVVYLIRSK